MLKACPPSQASLFVQCRNQRWEKWSVGWPLICLELKWVYRQDALLDSASGRAESNRLAMIVTDMGSLNEGRSRNYNDAQYKIRPQLRNLEGTSRRYPLRTLDAIHLASAIELQSHLEEPSVLISADTQLLKAAAAERLEIKRLPL